MDSSILNLGYTVRRAIRDDRDGLHVFSHDLGTFCVPQKHALPLANAYERYLSAAGILDWRNHPDCDEERYEGDCHALAFIRESRGASDDHQSLHGLFHLEEAIEFVEVETDLQKALVIRWCMMMEYITHEDQRLAQLKSANNPPSVEADFSHDHQATESEVINHGE